MAREKLFENKVKKYLDTKGAWYVKYFANAMTKAGIPDILACINGKFFGIEIKAETGHASELQEYHLRKIEKSGGIAVLLFPSGFDKFKKEIDFYFEHQMFIKPQDNLGYCKFKRGWYE